MELDNGRKQYQCFKCSQGIDLEFKKVQNIFKKLIFSNKTFNNSLSTLRTLNSKNQNKILVT